MLVFDGNQSITRKIKIELVGAELTMKNYSRYTMLHSANQNMYKEENCQLSLPLPRHPRLI